MFSHRRRNLDLGAVAWVGLIVYVLSYDFLALRFAKPTLSAAFYRASTAKSSKWGLLLFWLYLTGHLFRWIPKQADVFRRAFGA